MKIPFDLTQVYTRITTGDGKIKVGQIPVDEAGDVITDLNFLKQSGLFYMAAGVENAYIPGGALHVTSEPILVFCLGQEGVWKQVQYSSGYYCLPLASRIFTPRGSSGSWSEWHVIDDPPEKIKLLTEDTTVDPVEIGVRYISTSNSILKLPNPNTRDENDQVFLDQWSGNGTVEVTDGENTIKIPTEPIAVSTLNLRTPIGATSYIFTVKICDPDHDGGAEYKVWQVETMFDINDIVKHINEVVHPLIALIKNKIDHVYTTELLEYQSTLKLHHDSLVEHDKQILALTKKTTESARDIVIIHDSDNRQDVLLSKHTNQIAELADKTTDLTDKVATLTVATDQIPDLLNQIADLTARVEALEAAIPPAPDPNTEEEQPQEN